jgi:hypothetical protein
MPCDDPKAGKIALVKKTFYSLPALKSRLPGPSQPLYLHSCSGVQRPTDVNNEARAAHFPQTVPSTSYLLPSQRDLPISFLALKVEALKNIFLPKVFITL